MGKELNDGRESFCGQSWKCPHGILTYHHTEPGHGSGKYNQAEHPESGFVQHRVFSCKDDLTQRVNSLPSQSYGLLENQLVHNIPKLYAPVHTEFSAIKK